MKVLTLFPCGNKAYGKKVKGNPLVLTRHSQAVVKKTIMMMIMDVNLV